MTLEDLAPKLRELALRIERRDVTKPETVGKRLREWADEVNPPKTVRHGPQDLAGRW